MKTIMKKVFYYLPLCFTLVLTIGFVLRSDSIQSFFIPTDSAVGANDSATLHKPLPYDSVSKRELFELELNLYKKDMQTKHEKATVEKRFNIVFVTILLALWIVSAVPLYYQNSVDAINKEKTHKDGQINEVQGLLSKLKEEKDGGSKANILNGLEAYVKKPDFPNINQTLYELTVSSLKYNLTGIIFLIFSCICLGILGMMVFGLFENTIHDINQLGDNQFALAVILIIIRSSLLGSFILAFLLFSIRFSKAAFDQAARFNKRKHAAMFLVDMAGKIGEINPENLKALMKAFEEWNVNVESAFSEGGSRRYKHSKTDAHFQKMLIELFQNREKK